MRLAGVFPSFYIELQRAGRADDEAMSPPPCSWRRGWLPVVATHQMQFGQPMTYRRTRRVVHRRGRDLANQRRVRRFTRDQYFKSSAEMQGCLPTFARSAIANRSRSRQLPLTLVLGKPQLPDFPAPAMACPSMVFPPRLVRGPQGAPAAFPAEAERESSARATRAAGVRAGHHSEDGLSGLLPHRGRLHPVGQDQRLPGGAPAVARAQARWWPMR